MGWYIDRDLRAAAVTSWLLDRPGARLLADLAADRPFEFHRTSGLRTSVWLEGTACRRSWPILAMNGLVGSPAISTSARRLANR